jgi:mannitol-1-phosphate/altronate dehydrogenase
LLGHRTTDEAMADPLVAGYLSRLLADEISPLLDEPPGLNLAEYRRTLLDRFANPLLGDPLERLCGRGSTKVAAYLLPSLVDARRAGRPSELLAFAVAAWLRYLRGFDLEGERIAIRDERLEILRPLALAGGDDPRRLLSVRSVFGDLIDDELAVRAIRRALRQINTLGLRRALALTAATAEPLAA